VKACQSVKMRCTVNMLVTYADKTTLYAHAVPLRSPFGAHTRCSSRPVRHRAVRVSAAAVQQQPPRSWKLAAAVCQIWQSHQTQQATPAQVRRLYQIHAFNCSSPGCSVPQPVLVVQPEHNQILAASHLLSPDKSFRLLCDALHWQSHGNQRQYTLTAHGAIMASVLGQTIGVLLTCLQVHQTLLHPKLK
jgi:hypothetical protein